MATINKKAIKEILDYDAQINRRAFNATKKQVKKWKDEEENPEEEPLLICNMLWTQLLALVK